jgi:hypothetical protein
MGTLDVKFEGKRRRQSYVAGVSSKMPGVGAFFLVLDRPSRSSFLIASPIPGQFTSGGGGLLSSHNSERWPMTDSSVKNIPLVSLILQTDLDSISSGTNRPPL